MIVTNLTRAWCSLKPCMIIIRVAPVVDRLSLWVFGDKRCNRNVCTLCEELVAVKGYLRIVWAFPSEW